MAGLGLVLVSRVSTSLPSPSHISSQELVFFPKEKMTDSELIKLNQALKAPGMSEAALQAVSMPAANLVAWLWALLCYALAQRRGLPTGMLLRQVETTLAREQARLSYYQFQAQEMLEHTLALTTKLEEAQASHKQALETLSQAQYGQFHKWPIEAALLAPMHTWTTQLQVTSLVPKYLPIVHFTLHPPHTPVLLMPLLLPSLLFLACFPQYPALPPF